MLRKLLVFILFVSVISCQQEDSFNSENLFTLEEQTESFNPSHMDVIDPSIVESEWWKNLHPTVQHFTGIELAQKDPITFKELENIFSKSNAQAAIKAKICPGYPANPQGDVTLNSQADVNAFGALKCKEIIGVLEIVDILGPDPICDLSPLNKIKKIGSSLTINSNCLTSLSGLEKIKSVGELGPFGFVGVIGSSLVDIEALSKLSTVTGSINIIECDQLTSVTGAFSRITAIESGKTSAALTSLYVLNIDRNELLTDLSAFSNISNIEGGLRILTNGSLLNLDDFSGLDNIGEDIFVFENLSLQNVDELSNITAISDDLFVLDNPALMDCCGLFGLLCSDPPTCSTTGVGDNAAVFNNGAGCEIADIVAGGACN